VRLGRWRNGGDALRTFRLNVVRVKAAGPGTDPAGTGAAAGGSAGGPHVAVIEVHGELDASVSPRLAALLGDPSGAAAGTVVDLAGARLIDATAVASLLRAAHASRERGRQLLVARARGPVLQVLEVAGVAKSLGAYLTRDEAVAAVAQPVPAPAAVGEPAGDTSFTGLADRVHHLLEEAGTLPAGDPRRQALRERAVEQALPYSRRLAVRYSHRGEPVEDLYQVAAMGLVKAVNGYQPERQTGFLGYATPTILGELRRHFRDAGWTMRVPRRVQELRLAVNRAAETLTQALGRRPGTADLASFLDVPEADVRECLAASQNYHPVSLSTPLGPDDTHELSDAVGADDPALELVDYRQSVQPLLASLTPHEREVVALRFFGDLTQSQIAARVGTSQMHVSRLLTAVLGRLRCALFDRPGPEAGAGEPGARPTAAVTRSGTPRPATRRPQMSRQGRRQGPAIPS
jgi:RNA polymerase sigma-B factor